MELKLISTTMKKDLYKRFHFSFNIFIRVKKMSIGQLANRIMRTKRYGTVDAQYYPDGSFTLAVEVGGKRVRFCSDQEYTTVSESPLLGKIRESWRGPYEVQRTAPEVTIEVPSTNTKEEILYDDVAGVLIGVIQREDKPWLVIASARGKVLYQGPQLMPETITDDLISYFITRFKEECRLLNVKTHRKIACKRIA